MSALIDQAQPSTANLVFAHDKSHGPSVGYLLALRSKTSRRVMGSYLNRVAQMFGYANHLDAHWHKMGRDEVQLVMDKLLDNHRSPNTARVYLSAIKGVMREAWIQKRIDAEQYERIKLVKAHRGQRLPKGRRLLDEEVKALLCACDLKTVRGARDAALLGILAECGLRRAEVVSIQLKDVNLKTKTIRLIGKGNKERQVFVPPLSIKHIQTWLSFRGEEPGYLFNRVWKGDTISEHGLSDQAVLFLLKEKVGQACIDSCAPHDLRRTFATKLFELNVDPLTVQKAMGHASLTTTQRYDRRNDDEVARVAEAFSYD
ncbi:tyrosine-type recombinase/integrase [Thiomicrospira microaerophila]|uniref:tyrosine-type recombinase/integrase n=1 Tax=Thiomicrospira microaerophila TaxID=406020 RepID=UPI0006960C98|nr:site-specific integrase [Thiomicrospira microaerophila]